VYLFKSGAVMAENIEQRINDFEKFYFNAGIIGKGGMAKVYKLVFNPYLYYSEIMKDGNDYQSVAKIFQEEMTQAQRDEVYADAERDASQSGDKKLLSLLEKKLIAVKELTINHDKITPRFRKEIAFLVSPSLHHSNIVQGYGWIPSKDGEGIKLLMEYIDAIPIDSLKGKLPIPFMTYVAIKVADALEFCHTNDVLHRDVKPLNILVETDKDFKEDESLSKEEKEYEIIKSAKKIKLTDFGLVKSIDTDVASQTLVGEFFGTPKFYAPECVELGIKNFSKKSEVFTLCATLYDLLCGVAPIQSVLDPEKTDTISVMVTLQTTPDFVFPKEYNPKISKPLQNIIMMGLAKNPNERPSMGDVKWLLENLLKGKHCIEKEETLEEITKKTTVINKQYSMAKRNPTPSVYWNLADNLLKIQGKEEEAIQALTNALELFKKMPDNPKVQSYISMCERLISVEKRGLNAPKRKTQQNIINNQ
jgi:serine/threonine protein kinase